MMDIGKDLQNAYDDGYKQRDAEIVRCKDCKWFDGYECCDRNGLFVGVNYETFFCADGERRENDG